MALTVVALVGGLINRMIRRQPRIARMSFQRALNRPWKKASTFFGRFALIIKIQFVVLHEAPGHLSLAGCGCEGAATASCFPLSKSIPRRDPRPEKNQLRCELQVRSGVKLSWTCPENRVSNKHASCGSVQTRGPTQGPHARLWLS